MIYFAIQCHNFQWRLCWQLSSIAQQISAHTELPKYQYSDPIPEDLGRMPEIIVDVAYMPGNGIPDTESVIWYYRQKGLRIVDTVVEDRELFARRGLVRNLQIKNADSRGADWLFFADCDNVYHPHFFCRLARALEKYDGPPRCIYSREKVHTEVGATDAVARLAMINKGVNYAYERAMSLPRIQKQNKNVAAGCMQVVKPEWCGGVYVKRSNDRHLFEDGQKARSDVRFRNRIGGQHRIHLPVQAHMNHTRDKEVGYHLECQR